MFRGLYDWTLDRAGRPAARWWLAGISFAESSFFPIPPDVMLLPMVLADRARAWQIAAICTVASVAGAMAGYLIGALLFQWLGQPLLDFYGYQDAFAHARGVFDTWGLWAVLIGGLTPIPFKVVTIAAGVFGFDPVLFIVSALIARGFRFFVEAALLWRFGRPIRRFVERRLNVLVTAGLALLVAGFVVLRGL
ncbi:cytochrome b [Rhodothalassium salexigens]|uniref:YqaA family protein n=1 Tax=Rhodothalassium salexigens TaxID=1086 RepID=UPI001911DA95|nr:YqaA family protein [Rhodothalassium salexigens]MBK5910038.1 cytochrome b [Rhodothalassium salexigens]